MGKYTQGILDRFTRSDELLAEMIPILKKLQTGDITVQLPEGPDSVNEILELLKYQHKKDYEVHFFTYPNDGTKATLGVGDTTIDFRAGTVKDSAGVVTKLSNSLMRLQLDFLRSVALNADEEVVMQLDTKDKIIVKADNWFVGAYQQFTRIIITCAVETELFLLCCTNPEAIDITGDVFVKDPKDTWGKSVAMGLGEHAVRTHAPPITFDRRGNVLRWIDFESPRDIVDSYLSYLVTSRERSTDYSGTGDFSYKIVLGNEGYFQGLNRTQDFHLGKVGGSVLFATTSAQVRIGASIWHYDGSKLWIGVFSIELDDGKIYVGPGDTNHVGTINYFQYNRNFSTLKVVVDLATHKYVRGLAFGQEFDLTAYSMTSSVAGLNAHLGYGLYCRTLSGGATAYIDNMILTENEPL